MAAAEEVGRCGAEVFRMNDDNLFNAAPRTCIVQGHCVCLDGDGLVSYGGPIKSAPDMAGLLVLLNPVDFEKLKQVIDRKCN